MNRIAVTRINDKIVSLYISDETIYDVVISDDDKVNVGDIYVGRVQNVVNNINAAFVEILPNVRGYLKLSDDQKKSVKAEQEIIVQIKKPAKDEKDVVVSTETELSGRYVVLQKNASKGVHISRKITDEQTVSRLKNIADSFNASEDISITIRTNAADASEEAVTSEFNDLNSVIENINNNGNKRVLYSRLYREAPAYIRHINSYRTGRVDRIVTDQKDIFEELTGLSGFAPYDDGDKSSDIVTSDNGMISVEFYTDDSYPMDARYAISTTLKKATERRVWLKSGANLIIDRTEAMTVIDVNTAKAVAGKRASESTFLKINLEAADEIARQLRLRNISGIIIVDFIDMRSDENRDRLISRMRELLKEDPVKAMYVDFTKLGLMELTRKKQYSETIIN